MSEDFATDPNEASHAWLAAERCRRFLSEGGERSGESAEPLRDLFERLSLAPGGTGALVEMRRQLLCGLAENPTWAAVEADLAGTLRSRFNDGRLVLQRIDGQTPTPVLEQLIHYEAVHQMRGWRDVQRRLEADRRCYAFFHPALPGEPLIFTELALTRNMSANIRVLLDPDSPVLDAASCDAAIFYSISSCHEGLRGVPFGNALIRQVIGRLAGEFPRLKTFATLSPIPGFRPWLAGLAESGEEHATKNEFAILLDTLDASDWFEDSARSAELERALVPLCAYYLLREKRGKEPADAVTRFHAGNGARLERLNWLSDTSPAAVRHSAGLMVNYLYDLVDLERNHDAYVRVGKVIASRQLERLSKKACTMLRRAGRMTPPE